MSLLPLIEQPEATEAQARFLAQTPPLNLFKALANAPDIGTEVARMGGLILYQTKLDARLRELAILRAAHLAASAYEVGHHERIGRDVGLSDADLAAVRNDGDLQALDPLGRLAAQWAQEVVKAGRAAPALVREAIEALGRDQAVELSITVGYYLMVASFLETFEIPFEGSQFDQGVKIDKTPDNLRSS